MENKCNSCDRVLRSRTRQQFTELPDGFCVYVYYIPVSMDDFARNGRPQFPLGDAINIKSKDNISGTFDCIGSCQHVGPADDPDRGHYLVHLKKNGVFYQGSDDADFRPSDMSDVRKSFLFMFNRVH